MNATKAQRKKEEELRQFNFAAKIQALVRGVLGNLNAIFRQISLFHRFNLGRSRFRKDLPALKRARMARQFCVECEIKPGSRRCRQCKDRYCSECFQIVHSKGTRKAHTFENVKISANLLAAAQIEQEKGLRNSNDDNGNRSKTRKKDKGKEKEWEEFYDPSARAKYWFNKATGEASWISPF